MPEKRTSEIRIITEAECLKLTKCHGNQTMLKLCRNNLLDLDILVIEGTKDLANWLNTSRNTKALLLRLKTDVNLRRL